MSESEAVPICAVCGVRCDGQPHAIGADGALICRACLDKHREAWALSRPQERKLVAHLLAEQMENAWQCPECNHFVPQDSIICFECGYNRKKRRRVETRVRAPRERKRGRGR